MAPILNYTTQIVAKRTLRELSRILTQHGARAILTEFDGEGDVAALSFRVLVGDYEVASRLPADWRPILVLLEQDRKIPKKSKTKGQSIWVAWRIIKDWVEAQMALIETQMVTMEQVLFTLCHRGRWADGVRAPASPSTGVARAYAPVARDDA